MRNKQTPKDAATERLLWTLESLTRCLASLQSRYDTMITATDDDTFSHLCRLHGELSQLTKALGIDRVRVNPKTDNYEWVTPVTTPDGEWRCPDPFEAEVAWRGYRAKVTVLSQPPYDVTWTIFRGDRAVFSGLVSGKNNPIAFEDCKAEAMAHLKRLAAE